MSSKMHKPEIWGTVQQPIIFPPVYMMERFARCDRVVIFDNAQFDRDNVQFKLMSKNGPIIKTVQLKDAPHTALFNQRWLTRANVWAHKLKFAMQTIYGMSRHYKALKEWFEDLVDAMALEENLTEFCTLSVTRVSTLIGLGIRFHISTDLISERHEDPVQCLADLCSHLQITDYVQGERSMRSYFTKGPFEQANVNTWAQDYEHSWLSNDRTVDASFSILDMLFSKGLEYTRNELGKRHDYSVHLVTR